ncbi:hypothetical protein JCM13304A_11890 [Desulfothermus okinawensis JCM 13304]
MGGLARRKTAFAKIKRQFPDGLFIGGYFEVTNINGQINPYQIKKLVKAFDKLGYDIKVINGSALKNHPELKQNGWISSKKQLIIKYIKRDKNLIGVVIFPEKLRSVENIDIEKIKLARRKSHILIGISPYGYELEKRLLINSKLCGILDLLLGSGRGPSFTNRSIKNTIWVRPISKGKAIYLISFENISKGKSLVLGKNVTVSKKYLSDNLLENKEIKQILME